MVLKVGSGMKTFGASRHENALLGVMWDRHQNLPASSVALLTKQEGGQARQSPSRLTSLITGTLTWNPKILKRFRLRMLVHMFAQTFLLAGVNLSMSTTETACTTMKKKTQSPQIAAKRAMARILAETSHRR